MDIIPLILVALHFLGMAALVGVFMVQLRQRSGYHLTLMVAGAVTQLVTGLALVGMAEMADRDLNYMKIGFKLAIALGVLVATVVMWMKQRKGDNAAPFFHTAGGLAVLNLLIAVFWN